MSPAERASDVDPQPQPVVLVRELDDRAPLGRMLDIAHGERRVAIQTPENLLQLRSLGITDEQHVASAQLARFAIALHDEGMALHALAAHRRIELRAEAILTEHAQREGRIRGAERLCGPLDELGEIEQEDGFDLILARSGAKHRHGGREAREPRCSQK